MMLENADGSARLRTASHVSVDHSVAYYYVHWESSVLCSHMRLGYADECVFGDIMDMVPPEVAEAMLGVPLCISITSGEVRAAIKGDVRQAVSREGRLLLPIGEAKRGLVLLGLVDDCFGTAAERFDRAVVALQAANTTTSHKTLLHCLTKVPARHYATMVWPHVAFTSSSIGGGCEHAVVRFGIPGHGCTFGTYGFGVGCRRLASRQAMQGIFLFGFAVQVISFFGDKSPSP